MLYGINYYRSINDENVWLAGVPGAMAEGGSCGEWGPHWRPEQTRLNGGQPVSPRQIQLNPPWLVSHPLTSNLKAVVCNCS